MPTTQMNLVIPDSRAKVHVRGPEDGPNGAIPACIVGTQWEDNVRANLDRVYVDTSRPVDCRRCWNRVGVGLD